MPQVYGQELLLYPLTQIEDENICEKCEVKAVYKRWNVCLNCLRECGDGATLTCTLCVDCFKSPKEWAQRKSYQQRILRSQNLDKIIIEMDYIRAGQCPVCQIRISRMDKQELKLTEGEEMKVMFDELINIRALQIAFETCFKRKKKLERETAIEYDKKMHLLMEKIVTKAEMKQTKVNASDMKVKSILRRPSWFCSKDDMKLSKDEI